jgi:hypothetical protein
MKVEDLLLEARDEADWTKFFPPVNQIGVRRLNNIRGLVGRATARIAKIRKYAEESGNADLLRLLDYGDDSGNTEKS